MSGYLFDLMNPEPPRTPSQAPAEMRPRLSRQCAAILDALRLAPMTNRDLATLALKYTGRISELREAGYDVQAIAHDKATGLVTYALVGEAR